MSARFYTLLFAFLPRRLQIKLWGWLANRYGYRGISQFGNRSITVLGTPKFRDDIYRTYTEQMNHYREERAGK